MLFLSVLLLQKKTNLNYLIRIKHFNSTDKNNILRCNLYRYPCWTVYPFCPWTGGLVEVTASWLRGFERVELWGIRLKSYIILCLILYKLKKWVYNSAFYNYNKCEWQTRKHNNTLEISFWTSFYNVVALIIEFLCCGV